MAGVGSVVVRDVAARDLVVGTPERSVRQLMAF
jgi:acetyltransferase-like isoleucine patch superfamily enzyme